MKFAIRWMIVGMTIGGGMGNCRAGSVVNDGSLGSAAVVHSGNIFTIRPASGRQVGSNLFYSLSTLNLDQGETANFKGPASVANVLARVTGGSSTIDGTLQCTIPNANFYLINPAGIVFGPDAALNVQGSFAVTTANQLKLADGAVFGAPGAADATLTTAAPAAFGFLSAAPTSLTFNGPALSVVSGQSFTSVGGNTVMSEATVQASSGQVTLAAVASPGTVVLTGQITNPIDVSSVSALGPIQLTNSQITTNGPVGGRIVIEGGQLVATGSSVTAFSASNQIGQGINVQISGDLSLSASKIRAGGSGTGAAGAVSVTTATLEILNGGLINDSTIGAGAGGNVNVVVSGSATLDGSGASNSPTGILAESDLTSPGGGIGGTIFFQSGSLNLRNGAEISASSFGTAFAGTVNVGAGSIIVDAGTLSASANGSGDAGNITIVSTGNFTVRNGSLLTTQSIGGNAGSLVIGAGSLLIIDDSTAFALAKLHGGNIVLSAPMAIDLSDSVVRTQTGGGGSILVGGDSADTPIVALSDGSGIIARDFFGATGGNVSLASSALLETPDSILTASGTITIATPPDMNIAAYIVGLPEASPQLGLSLAPTCAHESNPNLSSFIVTGEGGLPPAPGGWLPNSNDPNR